MSDYDAFAERMQEFVRTVHRDFPDLNVIVIGSDCADPQRLRMMIDGCPIHNGAAIRYFADRFGAFVAEAQANQEADADMRKIMKP